jgi:ribonuclease BN (tRNA processing enzyme)
MLRALAAVLLSAASASYAAPQPCGSRGIALQVLGSGGPEMQDKRASSGYLIWQDGRARLLVDAGGGTALRFGESGASMSQLDAILFSHFHVDHSGDFVALVKSSWFEDRARPLPVYGPPGNGFMPSTTEFVAVLFGGEHGAYRYLSDLYEPRERGSYKLEPHDVDGGAPRTPAFRGEDLAAYPSRVLHGGVPALAWRIEIAKAVIVFSGDTSGEGGLASLASGAGLFVAHNAVPEGATGVERDLHMPPSVIGEIAARAHVRRLVLSHRMLRTLGREDQSRTEIRKRYGGPLEFANDLDCFSVP